MAKLICRFPPTHCLVHDATTELAEEQSLPGEWAFGRVDQPPAQNLVGLGAFRFEKVAEGSVGSNSQGVVIGETAKMKPEVEV